MLTVEPEFVTVEVRITRTTGGVTVVALAGAVLVIVLTRVEPRVLAVLVEGWTIKEQASETIFEANCPSPGIPGMAVGNGSRLFAPTNV